MQLQNIHCHRCFPLWNPFFFHCCVSFSTLFSSRFFCFVDSDLDAFFKSCNSWEETNLYASKFDYSMKDVSLTSSIRCLFLGFASENGTAFAFNVFCFFCFFSTTLKKGFPSLSKILTWFSSSEGIINRNLVMSNSNKFLILWATPSAYIGICMTWGPILVAETIVFLGKSLSSVLSIMLIILLWVYLAINSALPILQGLPMIPA